MADGTPNTLALYGGPKSRINPMPARRAFGKDEQLAVQELFGYYEALNSDFGFQGHFEKLYTDAFVGYMGMPGFADAVCTGTAALYIAVAALQLQPGSRVLVSPVTDPGTISAILLNGHYPVLMDSAPGSFNVGVEQFLEKFNDQISAAIIVHCAGKAAPIDEICKIAAGCGVPVIEDCSQAHGAHLNGRKVGTFGAIAVFSTMNRKAHATGGCGGVIFTRDEDRFNLTRSLSDRGKPFHIQDFNEKDPGAFHFPALNLNIDEISCAIGIKSLARLDSTISKRKAFLFELASVLERASSVCSLAPVEQGDSPFFHPVIVDTKRLKCTKVEFAEALRAEGVDVNPNYLYVVSDWPWVKKFLLNDMSCPNAIHFRDTSFNLLFNENYAAQEARDIVTAIVKVEAALT